MKVTSTVVILASLVANVAAHTLVWGAWVNGVDQGDGRNLYIRSPPNNNPVKNISTSDMACNVNNVPVPKTITVKPGDEFTFEWYHNTRDDDIIASSHHGPIAVYIAPTSSDGAGPVWVKLFEDTYNTSWAVDRLITAHGQHSIIVPNVTSGDYLLRAEIEALHEADVAYDINPIRGAQFYISCAQVHISSSSSTPLPQGVSFPGAYNDSTPGIVFNIYELNATTYSPPGPSVWSEALGGSILQVGQAST
ncbi:glycoside hydrolase family 61 protein [Abortiporus biennis]|nr:glycoside hydrolase family 61 protein [Abortiporus biennis]